MFYYTEKELKQVLDTFTILIDTREKSNRHITSALDSAKVRYASRALNYGDYSCKVTLLDGKEFYFTDLIAVERKANLEELSGNLTKNRERFMHEFLRANGKMYLLIENADYQDIELGNYNTQFNKVSFRASIDSFMHKYNINVHYQKNITYSGYYIYRTLLSYVEYYLKSGKIK